MSRRVTACHGAYKGLHDSARMSRRASPPPAAPQPQTHTHTPPHVLIPPGRGCNGCNGNNGCNGSNGCNGGNGCNGPGGVPQPLPATDAFALSLEASERERECVCVCVRERERERESERESEREREKRESESMSESESERRGGASLRHPAPHGLPGLRAAGRAAMQGSRGSPSTQAERCAVAGRAGALGRRTQRRSLPVTARDRP